MIRLCATHGGDFERVSKDLPYFSFRLVTCCREEKYHMMLKLLITELRADDRQRQSGDG